MAEIGKLQITATVLKRWAPVTHTLLKDAIQRTNAVDTKELINSLSYDVNISGGDQGSSVSFSFLNYGRFRDMGVGRGASVESASTNEAAARRKGRKPARWWAKTVYSRIYGSLIAQLAGGYREKLIRDQKGMLKGKLI